MGRGAIIVALASLCLPRAWFHSGLVVCAFNVPHFAPRIQESKHPRSSSFALLPATLDHTDSLNHRLLRFLAMPFPRTSRLWLVAQRTDRSGGKGSSKRVKKPTSSQWGSNQQRVAAAHTVKRGDTMTVDILSLAGGSGKSAGSGVAKVDGLIVFVEGALPGSRVEVKVTDVKRGYVEASIVCLLMPSPDAAPAPCPFFRSQGSGCGGCKLLGMSYEAQLREKQTQVDKVFATAENSTVVRPIILHPIIAAAPPDRQQHRNRVDYAFSARQWLPPPEGASAFGGEVLESQAPARATGATGRASSSLPGRDAAARAAVFLGLRPSGITGADAVVDVDSCLLPSQTAGAIYSDIRAWLRNTEVRTFAALLYE